MDSESSILFRNRQYGRVEARVKVGDDGVTVVEVITRGTVRVTINGDDLATYRSGEVVLPA